MRTLLCSSKIPALSDPISSISSNKPRFLTPSPILLRPQKPPAGAGRVRANAKGFSGPSHTPTAKVGGGGGGAGDEEEQIPQVVYERMMVRIVGFVGVPMAAGIGLLHVLGVVKERGLWEVPLWVPFLTTLVCFGASALGIAYGTLSSSWDADRTGSVLGFEEAQRNWAEMWSDEGDS
ncbi:hypothetical protein CDL15_Pgr022999 [Punica granatum]|nr:hypothetical protein CDL15_Pgr022999 [Punica granatum]